MSVAMNEEKLSDLNVKANRVSLGRLGDFVPNDTKTLNINSIESPLNIKLNF